MVASCTIFSFYRINKESRVVAVLVNKEHLEYAESKLIGYFEAILIKQSPLKNIAVCNVDGFQLKRVSGIYIAEKSKDILPLCFPLPKMTNGYSKLEDGED